MKGFNKLNEFKNLKFQSVTPQDILQAVGLLDKLGYEVVRNDFSVYDAAKHNGVCAWDDGEITEGWLDDDNFEQVTLGELKEMVGAIKNNQLVLWLNKETLEERYLDKFSVFPYHSSWVEVPEGAAFATGDKDNFVFRKDRFYYEHGEWINGDVTIQNIHTYEFVKLFWVKGDKDNVFTLERLLGCEVAYKGVNYWVTSIYNISKGKHLILYNGTHLAYMPDLKLLTFFTEDGDELTFDEYVKLYYPYG